MSSGEPVVRAPSPPRKIKRRKFVFALAGVYLPTVGIIGLMLAAVWYYHDEPTRAAIGAIVAQHTAVALMLPVALLAVQGVLLEMFWRQYLTTPLEVAERTKLIVNANPSHRIEPTGGPELQELEHAINDLASRYEALQLDLAARIRESQARLEEEKNRLVALISELSQSVVVCNVEGRILLYNNQARELLGRHGGAASNIGGASLVGLGRSVFAILDRSLITHALEIVQSRLARREVRPVARFVASVGGQLIRVEMAPVLAAGADAGDAMPGEMGAAGAPPPAITGFLLIVEDVTRAIETGSRRDAFLQSLVENSRRATANIRAAVETLLGYPDMDARTKARFMEIIREEVSGLSHRLDRVSNEHAASLKNEWLLDEMLGADLVSAAGKRIGARVGVTVGFDELDGSLWVKVDSHSLVVAITWIARRLREDFGVRTLRLGLHRSGRLAHVDLSWRDAVVPADALAALEMQSLESEGEQISATLREILERHEGEVLHQVDRASATGLVRILLPIAQPELPAFRAVVAGGARPEYYDFDLFHQAGQTPELDERMLTDLAYTVFDTETTGLDPSGGDEIISIGAVRIVNRKLLRDDAFDQLVDPRRHVSPETIKITGIDPTMLKGQPPVDRVLPEFHKFCEDTVLVGHNAAFDMRFLQLKETQTGVRFTQPVLDTLLLAAAIQPNINANRLEDLAERFGVNAIGRHTALGDAMMTAEIFLKMLPLLANLGILTLRDAREASQKTLQARLRY